MNFIDVTVLYDDGEGGFSKQENMLINAADVHAASAIGDGYSELTKVIMRDGREIVVAKEYTDLRNELRGWDRIRGTVWSQVYAAVLSLHSVDDVENEVAEDLAERSATRALDLLHEALDW